MQRSVWVCVCAAAAVLCAARAGRHDAYSRTAVFGVQLRNTSDLELLHNLELNLDLDMWQYGMPLVRDAMVMVPPHVREEFLSALDKEEVSHYVHVENVTQALEKHDEDIARWKSSRATRQIFQGYMRYDDINAEMERIADRHPNLVTLVNAGKSFEGRDIKYLKISTTNFEDHSKPIYFMEAMIHAREWVTTPVAMYSVYRLVENLRAQDQDLLNDIDWIILPLVNPDGYEYSHTEDRLWRKTRSTDPTVDTPCIGVDGNRNFDVRHGVGTPTNPCAITYAGARPFSEPETGYVRDILAEHKGRVQIFMDIHSYGNYVLFAYGDGTLPPNAVPIFLVGSAMGATMDAMKLPQAGFYRVGNSATVLYSTSGSAQDYGQVAGAAMSYTLELPGYGYDFVVPPSYQDHINEETWQGIAVTARLSRQLYRDRYNAANTPR
ncbi:carboxypeptidase B-like [Spodoptera litura]|uniref:Carboxypeptidase B-like n=1 Tax=Spodoptera litura TaxID=69820 RepID=A0A9J7EPC2_SPOLT|nr:carboxypeptidase B-like [Spodoptera litura]